MRNNIFFCLLTPTLRQLVFKQKKMSLRAENSAQWKMAFEDQLAESGRQKTKENTIPRGKFRPVENGPDCDFSDGIATLDLRNELLELTSSISNRCHFIRNLSMPYD